MKLSQARARIGELKHLNAFISLTDEEGDGPVVAIKDLIAVRDSVTTGGGIILPREPDIDDAPVVARIHQAGCVVIGKTNLHEWAYGVTSVNPHYGAVLNPHDTNRIAGGSSGGSAVAAATGMCDWAIGTDTGGSIRIPAALCGVVGFKPTFGAIPKEGVLPLSRSLDTLGPLARDVATVAQAFAIMSGKAFASSSPTMFEPRLAVPRDWVADLDEPTAQVWKKVGVGLPLIEFPYREELITTRRTIQRWEAANVHRAWIEQVPEKYGTDVLTLLLQAMEISEESYLAAIDERVRLTNEVKSAMLGWDAILLPTTACVAPLLTENPLLMRDKLGRFTEPFNVTGQPIMSLPAPVNGLPVGIQVIGHPGDDERLIQIASALETQWNKNEVRI